MPRIVTKVAKGIDRFKIVNILIRTCWDNVEPPKNWPMINGANKFNISVMKMLSKVRVVSWAKKKFSDLSSPLPIFHQYTGIRASFRVP